MRPFIQDLAAKHHFQPMRLLEMLREIQFREHHVSSEAVELLAEALQIPRTRIIDAVEFYSFFSSTPKGRYELLISDSITDRMLGKQALMDHLAEKLRAPIGGVRGDGLVSLDNTSCTGMCDQGPAGLVNGYALTRLDFDRVDRIADLIERQIPISSWPAEFFAAEDNIHKPGLLLGQPIARGEGLQAAYTRSLMQTLSEIDASGLRGRGGAGFKTAAKWRFCMDEAENERYVVCNADEGEPGTFKDRVLLNTFADQVFEGMTLCGAILGAKQGFLYLRGEYLHLYDKLQAILEERRRQGLLGRNILGRNLDFDIEIRLGAGAYICGEESALIESLEGKSGIPRNRPPYPVTHGYLGKPTVVNNVESFFAAAAIAVHGGSWFAAHGTEKSKGTKILSISGDCARPGIYEYPFGTPIRTILHDCGGAKDVLGAQVGGPSGTFISNQEFDRLLAFEDLATGGSFIVFDNNRSILDIAHNFTHFFAHESCGFCTPCRVGTSLLRKQFDKIYDGHGSAGDVAALDEICRLVKTYSHCGLGQTAANPVLTTLARYPEAYESRLKQISYEPGFDLDAELETARRLANRSDAAAHLSQTGE
ncbi:MAG: NAD(P)H-dependent oxidoreductase subunit E [Methylomicrobium sp.]